MSASKIGVFFDLDGTLLPKPSLEWRFLGHLLACDEIRSAAVLRWLGNWAKTLLRNPRAAVDENKSYLAGLRESLERDWANSLEPGSPQMFSEGLARISWHITQQHQVFFVSGTLVPLACAIARSLQGHVEVIASRARSLRRLLDGAAFGRAHERQGKMPRGSRARRAARTAARTELRVWRPDRRSPDA